MNDRLDLSSFSRAIARLDEGWSEYRRDTARTIIRDGLIQRFEFTYEIAHKTLKRFLVSTSPSPAQYEGMSFQDLIRSGNEAGLLLGDWPVWKGCRDLRAKTSHVYDEEAALEVVAGIPAFMAEAKHLLENLERRIGG